MLKNALALALFVISSSVASAQVWNETGDAPDGPFTRQDTIGSGPLTTINGVLDRAAGDHVDTYSLVITDPSQFLVATNNAFGGSAVNQSGSNEDTRFWLWNLEGGLLLANDDVNSVGTNTLASVITDPATWPALTGEVVNPTAAGVVLTPGKYLLSISEFANDPEDVSNVDLADLGSAFDALHGMNPAAGPFDHWENATDTDVITYSIAVRGATFCVPEPVALRLLGAALIGFFSLRRR